MRRNRLFRAKDVLPLGVVKAPAGEQTLVGSFFLAGLEQDRQLRLSQCKLLFTRDFSSRPVLIRIQDLLGLVSKKMLSILLTMFFEPSLRGSAFVLFPPTEVGGAG